jgi:hypothetical protein
MTGAALSAVSPTCGELEGVFEVGIFGKFERGEEGPFIGQANGGFCIEQFGEAATESGGMG